MCACSMNDVSGDRGFSSGSAGNNNGNHAGSHVLTAGEWNDLENWDFWSNLLLRDEFKSCCDYWGFNTDGRIALQINTQDGKPATGAKVELYRNDEKIWTARCDNKGRANCWTSLIGNGLGSNYLSIYINGVKQEQELAITYLNDKELRLNEFTVPDEVRMDKSIDVAFFVDATGSMSDEIDFLKSDLVNILEKSAAFDKSVTMRSAALFYRDEGDEYLCKQQDFTTDPVKTADYVKMQYAGGGGDYEEAVHEALRNGFLNLNWNENSRSRIVFLILDAPAHDEQWIFDSLHASIRKYAEAGIQIIPVAASGADKSTEMMLRLFAIATGGTYTFLTDDSGVGNSHIEPSVGDFQVELLNDLMVRLITERME